MLFSEAKRDYIVGPAECSTCSAFSVVSVFKLSKVTVKNSILVSNIYIYISQQKLCNIRKWEEKLIATSFG